MTRPCRRCGHDKHGLPADVELPAAVRVLILVIDRLAGADCRVCECRRFRWWRMPWG